MLGQPASWQTVCRPSLFTSWRNSVYCGPITARVLIQAGLRSIGVWALRASMRSSLRPAAGAGVVSTGGALGSVTGSSVRGDQAGQQRLHHRQGVGDADLSVQLGGQGGDAGVGDAARDDPAEPAEVRIAVEREAVQRDALGDPDADRGDLALRAAVIGGKPDAAP